MTDDYSIPEQTKSLFHQIIRSERQHGLPHEILDAATSIEFTGSRLPSFAINWRFAESISSLKGFEAAMLNVLLKRKYGIDPGKAVINTDHAQLLFISSLILTVDPPAQFEVNPTPVRDLSEKYAKYFPLQDPHDFASTWHRRASTNIYKTADGQFLHIHGSLNPDPTILALGLPLECNDITTREASYKAYMDVVAKYSAVELESKINDQHRQACTIAHPPEAFQQSEHGLANANTGLYEVHHRPNPSQKPSWWPTSKETSVRRPLASLKVVDLTRVIAGPSATRELAELGASVMRVTAKHLPDFTGLHADLNWGKWNCCLDLRDEPDRKLLAELILDADVVVDGYRPGVFEKYGFGVEGVMKMCKDRERGIVYARENSYGWKGPWKDRSGWQPISDANTGVSFGFGRAMGNEEPVTPPAPNSDYCTGIIGAVGIMQALIDRAQQGGSYVVDFALNYYNNWLVTTCGEYPAAVWQDLWKRNGSKVFRHYESMNVTVPFYLASLKKNASDVILRPEFFERRRSGALNGLEMQVVKPAIHFPDGTVELGYNVGTRGNGVDAAKWPEDLMTEVVV